MNNQNENMDGKKPKVILIAAIGLLNNVIGWKDPKKSKKMPWPHISADLKRFKKNTLGYPIIMGRKTFEAFGARPLPERPNIVISRDIGYKAPKEVIMAHDLEDALIKAQGCKPKKIFVIGGGEIYKLALPYADGLDITLVGGKKYDGDVFFPNFDFEFKSIHKENPEEETPVPITYHTYERRNGDKKPLPTLQTAI